MPYEIPRAQKNLAKVATSDIIGSMFVYMSKTRDKCV